MRRWKRQVVAFRSSLGTSLSTGYFIGLSTSPLLTSRDLPGYFERFWNALCSESSTVRRPCDLLPTFHPRNSLSRSPKFTISLRVERLGHRNQRHMYGRNGNCGPFWRAETSVSPLLFRSAHAGRPAPTPFADLRDRPSGSFSNQHGQHPLRVEILDSKRRVHRAFSRPAARRRDRGQVRRRPAEISSRHGAPQFPLHPYRCSPFNGVGKGCNRGGPMGATQRRPAHPEAGCAESTRWQENCGPVPGG